MQIQKFGRKNWTVLLLFGLIGQIAWSVENMYFNLFVFKTIAPDLDAITLMVQLSGIAATVTTLIAIFGKSLGLWGKQNEQLKIILQATFYVNVDVDNSHHSCRTIDFVNTLQHRMHWMEKRSSKQINDVEFLIWNINIRNYHRNIITDRRICTVQQQKKSRYYVIRTNQQN